MAPKFGLGGVAVQLKAWKNSSSENSFFGRPGAPSVDQPVPHNSSFPSCLEPTWALSRVSFEELPNRFSDSFAMPRPAFRSTTLPLRSKPHGYCLAALVRHQTETARAAPEHTEQSSAQANGAKLEATSHRTEALEPLPPPPSTPGGRHCWQWAATSLQRSWDDELALTAVAVVDVCPGLRKQWAGKRCWGQGRTRCCSCTASIVSLLEFKALAPLFGGPGPLFIPRPFLRVRTSAPFARDGP